MWWVVSYRSGVFATKGWRRVDDYYVFRVPLLDSPSHILSAPHEWVQEIVALVTVMPRCLPSEMVGEIGAYM